MSGAARAILLACIVCLGARARAAESEAARADAQAHLEQGRQLAAARKFAEALAEFRAAHALVPSPRVLFNIAQMERELGKQADALEHYEEFARQGEAKADEPDFAPRIRAAKEAAAGLRPLVGTLQIAADPGTEVLVDARPRGAAPLAGPVYLDPGPHVVVFRHGERELRRDVEATAGQVVHTDGLGLLAVPLAARPQPPAPASPHPLTRPPVIAKARTEPTPAFYRRWYFWGAVGAVLAAGAGVGIYLARRPQDCPSNVLCLNPP